MSIIPCGHQDPHAPCTLIVYVTLPLTLHMSPLASGTHIRLVGVDGASCTHLTLHACLGGSLGGDSPGSRARGVFVSTCHCASLSRCMLGNWLIHQRSCHITHGTAGTMQQPALLGLVGSNPTPGVFCSFALCLSLHFFPFHLCVFHLPDNNVSMETVLKILTSAKESHIKLLLWEEKIEPKMFFKA